MRKIFLSIFFLILFIGLVSAEFNPRDNITGKNTYWITDFVGINATIYYGNGSQLSGIVSSVSNSSSYWDNLDTYNSTQMENSGGVLNILVSWLTSLFYTKSEVGAINTSMKNYVDSQDVIFNNSVNNYITFNNQSVVNYVNSQDLIFNNSNNNYIVEVNNTLANWITSNFVQIANIVNLVGNWSADKGSYYTSNQVNEINTSISNYISSNNISMNNYVIYVNGTATAYTNAISLAYNDSNNNYALVLNTSNNNYILYTNETMQSYVDAVNLAINNSNNNYAVVLNTSNNNYILFVNGTMKDYVDLQNSSQNNYITLVNTSMKNYVDVQNASMLNWISNVFNVTRNNYITAVNTSLVSWIGGTFNTTRNNYVISVNNTLAGWVGGTFNTTRNNYVEVVNTSMKNYVDLQNTSQTNYINWNNLSVTNYIDSVAGAGEPLWTANYTAFNASWSSTTNSTYNLWAYNQTIPALDYADTKLITTFYNATSVETIAGTPEGSLSDIISYDRIFYNVTELGSTDALDVRVNFTDMTEFNQLIFRYKSSDIESHLMGVYLWDYVDENWEGYQTLGATPIATMFTNTVFDSSKHIDGGTVQVRFYTSVKGSTNHIHYFDWVSLSKGPATPSSTETDPYWSSEKENYYNKTQVDDINTSMKNYVDSAGEPNWNANYTNIQVDCGANVAYGVFSNGTLKCKSIEAGAESDPYWTANYSAFNSSWSSTYNSTVNASINNYISSNNASVVNWANSVFVQISNIINLVGNWSADKANYYTSTQVNEINTSMKNYADWLNTSNNNYIVSYVGIQNTSLVNYIGTVNTSMKNYVDSIGEPKWNANYSTFLTHITWATATNGTLATQAYVGIQNTSLVNYITTVNTSMKNYADTTMTAQNTSQTNYINSNNASVTNALNTKLNLAGGTMTGNLNMSTKNITMNGNGVIYSNATCIAIKSSTVTFLMC